MLSFNQIPIDIRTPGQYIEFDNSRAVQGLPTLRQKILIIGQRLAIGSYVANQVRQIASASQAGVGFGRGSMLAGMCAAFLAANPYVDVWAIALDDLGAGVAASGKFTFSGSPTAAGTLNLYLGGVRVQVGITAGMAAADVATAAVAAINAKLDLPATAVAAGADCNVTFRHKGLAGNSFDLRINFTDGDRTPAGLTVVTTAMAGGAGNPDMASVIAALGDDQYHTIVMPYTDAANVGLLEVELLRRWGPMIQREGQAFAAATGFYNTLTALGATRNSPHLTIMGAGRSPTAPWIWAAVTAAVDASEGDPARPRQTMTLPGCLPAARSHSFTREERNNLLHSGISTHVVDASGTVRIERLITTWQVDANGDDDVSYLDVETMRTLAYLRTSTRVRIADRFPRHKLADDGTQYASGQAIVTPSQIKAELLHLFREWELAGLVENFEQFKRELVVERNAGDRNRIDAVLPPDTVNQLRVFAAQIQFIK